jgi:hypothetical protein
VKSAAQQQQQINLNIFATRMKTALKTYVALCIPQEISQQVP